MTTMPGDSVGQGHVVFSLQVGQAQNMENPALVGLMVELFQRKGGKEPVTEKPVILPPYLAGVLAGALAKRCQEISPDAFKSFTRGYTEGRTTRLLSDCRGDQ